MVKPQKKKIFTKTAHSITAAIHAFFKLFIFILLHKILFHPINMYYTTFFSPVHILGTNSIIFGVNDKNLHFSLPFTPLLGNEWILHLRKHT